MDYKKLNPNKIFLDRNGDGITDTVDLRLHLSPSCSNPNILSVVMDLAACLGFETMGRSSSGRGKWGKTSFIWSSSFYIGMNHELRGGFF